MARERKDYSGPLDPNLRFEDFSKEALVNLLREYQRLYLVLDGHWYTHVKAKYGAQEAFDFDMKVWESMEAYEPKRVAHALNIRGNDIEAYLKILQTIPAFPGLIYDRTVEIIDERHARIIVNRCTSLEYFEREGIGREQTICHAMEPQAFQWTASAVNPKIRVTPLKLPPRQSRDEVPHCIWDVHLED